MTCQYQSGGTCSVVAHHSEIPQALCVVADDACKVCQEIGEPESGNKVIASMCLRYIGLHAPERLDEAREEFRPFIQEQAVYGPATEVQRCLKRLGVDCGCGGLANQYNKRGLEWWQANSARAVTVMKFQAKAKAIPFDQRLTERIVAGAIRRASK